MISSLLMKVVRVVLRFIGGMIFGCITAYVGGQKGIDIRDEHNRKCPTKQRRPNNWGDTEGTYHVFYAFWIGLISGICFILTTDESSTRKSLLLTALMLGAIDALVCGYITYYTI